MTGPNIELHLTLAGPGLLVTRAGASSSICHCAISAALWPNYADSSAAHFIHIFLMVQTSFIHFPGGPRGTKLSNKVRAQRGEINHFKLSKWLLKSQTLRLFWLNPFGRVHTML